MSQSANSAPDLIVSPATMVTTATATDDMAFSVAKEILATATQATQATQATDIPVPNSIPISRPSFVVYEHLATVGDKMYHPGVWYHGLKSKGGDEIEVDAWVCSPLYVEAITSSDDREFGRLLRFRNSLGHWKQWAMPMSLLKGYGEDMRGELLNLGVEIDPTNRAHLAKYLFSVQPKRKAIAADKTGWHGEKLFVLPDQTIGDGDVVFQSPTGCQVDYATGGTLEQWQEQIGSLCSGNSFLVFSVCAALGSPLFTLLHKHGAGVHFGGDSSKGKTTGAYVAASVWGQGKSFISTWRATSNGLEGDASMRNDTIMILDEMKQADPRDIDAVVYMIANGKGKKRANRSGLAKASKQWNLFLMSNGEASLEAFMRTGGLKVFAGQDVRLPTVPVTGASYGVFDDLHDKANGKLFADHLQTKANIVFGHLGPAFIKSLIRSENYSQLSVHAEKLQNEFPAICEQEGRVAGNFAIIALAGELATDYGLVPWRQGESLQAAIKMFSLWKDNRADGNAENASILRDVRAYINKHGASRFEAIDSAGTPVVRDRAGWIKNVAGKPVYLFTDESLIEACPSTDLRRVALALKQSGWLHSYDSKRLNKNTRLGNSQQRLYWITPLDSTDE